MILLLLQENTEKQAEIERAMREKRAVESELEKVIHVVNCFVIFCLPVVSYFVMQNIFQKFVLMYILVHVSFLHWWKSNKTGCLTTL